MKTRVTSLALAVAALACVAYGRNVDLSTVPPRDEDES